MTAIDVTISELEAAWVSLSIATAQAWRASRTAKHNIRNAQSEADAATLTAEYKRLYRAYETASAAEDEAYLKVEAARVEKDAAEGW